VETHEPRYAVITTDGAVYLRTDDLGEARNYGEWLNSDLDIAATYRPGRASVFEVQSDGTQRPV
jgi:hypothetical protein